MRCKALARLRVQIAAEADSVLQAISADTGKPALDSLAGDILVTLEQMRFYERNAPRLLRTRKVGKPALFYVGSQFYEVYEPHGVVLIYSPYNYPFQLSVVPMISALFAGNAVILKCSDKTPGVARMIAELCAKAGLPQDLVQVVHDAPAVAAAYLDAGPDFVFFTGSTETGRTIATRAAELLIPTVLELGGKDAALVFADCKLERTVEGVTYGAFSNAGQVCVGIKRLYVEQAIYEPFLQRLIDRVRALRIGSFEDADFGLFGGEAAKQRLIAQIDDAVQRGASILLPKDAEITGETPVILSGVPADARLLQEETFGPVLCVASFRNEAEAIQLANAGAYSLSASVWTGSPARGRRIAAGLNAGSCAINDVIRNIANPYTGFGGNRMSGYGRYHGPQGLYAFSRVKSVMVTGDRRAREMHWFPFRAKTLRSLKKVIAMRHNLSGFWSGIRRLMLVAIFSLVFSAMACAELPREGHLKITVKARGKSGGEIAYLVFASRGGFPDDVSKAVRSGFVPVSSANNEVTIDAGALPPGRYAVTVYQDVNGNHKLDLGILGIPKEPLGASNHPKPRWGPPRFEDCAFSMGHSDQNISISLVYTKDG